MEEGRGHRFLAATVVVPPSMAERLNIDALVSACR
jgi:hypothetical protein